MSTIDKFMVRAPNPSKEKLSTKKCTSSEVSQYAEDEVKARKHGKCRQKDNHAAEDADINGEAGKAASGLHTESTVEISYEDYLTENCDEPVEPDLTDTKSADESQNAGRDIRSFFSKGPATFKPQNASFSTIKVKAEVHEPCSKLSGEEFARKSTVLLPGIFGKQRDGRRKCNKGCIEITDDDLVIECLEDEIIKSDDVCGLPNVPALIKSDEVGGQLKVPHGIKSDEVGGQLKVPHGIKSDEVGGQLKVPHGIKSDEVGELLKVPVGIDSTLKNSNAVKLNHENIIDKKQLKETPIPVKIIDAGCGESPAGPEIAMVSALSGSATERQNMNDVLMARQKQVQEPVSQKQKRNSDGVSTNNKDKKAEVRRRVRGKGSQVNGCTKKDVDAGEKSVSRDDEETRLYLSPESTFVSSAPESTIGEVCKEQVSEIPKALKSNTIVGKLVTANMTQMTSDSESPKRGASPVAEGEGRTLRRSRRQSAAVAMAAIAIAMQDSGSKKQKKTVAEDDEEPETIDLDSDAESMPEDAKVHPSRRTNVPTKPKPKVLTPGLAPIFVKRKSNDSSKIPTPKLSAAEREAILIKRSFLLSGVPVELKKIQNTQQLATLPLVDAPFPTHSHTYQGNSSDDRSNGTVHPWCLPEVTLKLKDLFETVLPSVDVKILHLGQLTSLSNDESGIDSDRTELGSLVEISKDVLPVLLSEVKLRNPSFPTDRVYHQLSLRKNRDSKTKPNDISQTSASPHLNATAVKSKKVSKRKKAGNSDVLCEKAEDDSCLETQSLLWTEKYAPTRANEIIGNWDACKKLRDWLTEWKQVVSRHSSNGYFQPDRKPYDDVSGDFEFSDDNSNYCDSDDGSLCNTMLLLGAHGIGKTSMVYALAQELDFKVFEVNASGSRDGRYVMTQLQEATQSHQVSRGSRTDATCEQCEEPCQVKEKTLGRQKSPKKSNPVGGFLARWSAMQSMFEPEEAPPKKKFRRTKSTERRSPSKKQKQLLQSQDTKAQNQDTRKPSLILFDEVDTVFEDDRGFWSAVQTFMKTTKRPIILTATDRRFVEKFGGRCETLQLRTPRLVNTTSYVQLVCLLENVRTSYSDLLSLVESFNGDIRRTLLSLQYWVDSGAARHLVSNQPVHRYVDTCHSKPQNLVPETKAKDEIATETYNASKVQEIDDDFQRIVPRKRRRIQICSDDESSSRGGSRGPSSVSSPAKNVLQEIEDVSQSCSLAPSESEFRYDAELADREVKEAEDGMLLPLHGLNGQVLGIYNASGLTQDLLKYCATQVFASCRHQKSPILDQFIRHLQSSVTKQELCAEGRVLTDSRTIDGDCKTQQTSMKSLYIAYKNISYTDVYCCAMSKRCADEDMRGNTFWHFQEKADETIDAIEALVLSMSGVRRKDGKGKRNAPAEKLAAELSDNDSQIQDNYYSRLFQENASIVEGAKQSVIQPTSTLCADYMPALRAICKSEELRKATPHRRRFNHYLSNALPTMKCSLFKNMALQFP